MARLKAPNGVEVNASAADEPVFLDAGYTRVDERPDARKRAPRAKAKPKPKEE